MIFLWPSFNWNWTNISRASAVEERLSWSQDLKRPEVRSYHVLWGRLWLPQTKWKLNLPHSETLRRSPSIYFCPEHTDVAPDLRRGNCVNTSSEQWNEGGITLHILQLEIRFMSWCKFKQLSLNSTLKTERWREDRSIHHTQSHIYILSLTSALMVNKLSPAPETTEQTPKQPELTRHSPHGFISITASESEQLIKHNHISLKHFQTPPVLDFFQCKQTDDSLWRSPSYISCFRAASLQDASCQTRSWLLCCSCPAVLAPSDSE